MAGITVTSATVRIDALTPHPRNYNRHPASQLRKLTKSLRKFGQVRSIVVWRDYIIAGHGLTEAARAAKWETLRADVLPDDYPEHLALAYVAADNELARQGDPDTAQLLTILEESRATDAELLEAIGFDDADYQRLLTEVGGGGNGKDIEPQVDRAEELRQKWGVEPGQLWQLGEHRLICGDCTDAAVVARVMGGERAALVSDPPYGINVDTSWLSALHVQRGKPANASDARLVGDDGTLDLSWAYKYPQWLVFGFPYVARGEQYTGLLVWDKRGDGGEDGLGNPVEVAASNAFNGYRLSRHIWAGYVREAGEKRHPHPTQKPVGIMVDAIELVKGDLIFDPFLGSGTTLIACENLGRRCRAVEIAPGYVAVALERWATHTGQTPVLLES